MQSDSDGRIAREWKPPGQLALALDASALAHPPMVIRQTLLGGAIIRYGRMSLSTHDAFAGLIYLRLALILLVYGIAPRWFFAAAWPAIQLSLVSRPSISTQPVTEAATERLSIQSSWTGSPPLCHHKVDG